ncbi:phosphoribosyltransferase [Amycolatopsis sp. NPDC049868]|uniref:phosphoribosyltransferase n=1 Tax=Amycolatopsis sp. NPDC049868 TaxID=3363934 RepID=UPI003790FC94
MPATYRAFADRRMAGRRLAHRIGRPDWPDPVVLGLARGGVPVAAEVACEFGAPLDVAVSRKIGAPWHPEFGVGAVTADGPPYYDTYTMRKLGLSPADLARTCEAERAEARRRLRRYHGDRAPVATRGRDVLLVDDGLATGVTATAALRALRRTEPRRLMFATPVCAVRAPELLRDEADDVRCLIEPEQFRAVGHWYEDFSQTSDEEVVSLLDAAVRGFDDRRTW